MENKASYKCDKYGNQSYAHKSYWNRKSCFLDNEFADVIYKIYHHRNFRLDKGNDNGANYRGDDEH